MTPLKFCKKETEMFLVIKNNKLTACCSSNLKSVKCSKIISVLEFFIIVGLKHI